MKYSMALLFLLFVAFTPTIQAQTTSASNTDLWLTQIDEAKTKAKNNNQPIVMLFSGSDWCRPCMAMKQRILDHNDFTAYAAENVVLLEVDFPRKSGNRLSAPQQKHNAALADQYAPKYFPTLVVIDADGKEIDRIGYQASLAAADYVKFLQHRTARK